MVGEKLRRNGEKIGKKRMRREVKKEIENWESDIEE